MVWAEDVEGDQVLIRSALESLPHPPGVRFALDGQQAVDEAIRQRPRLIVLDVNMPRVDGIEALRRIKANPELRDVLVMFSTARNDDEVAACQDLGAVAFVQKPMGFDDFAKAVKGIIDLAA